LLSWPLAWPILCNRPSDVKNSFNFLQVFVCLSSSVECLIMRECLLFASGCGDDFTVRIPPTLELPLRKPVGRD
jgi:hypothetical protein